jgi:hypothetical protein
MALCEDCGREMRETDSCTVEEVLLPDGLYARVRYGAETEDWGALNGRRCHDCNVAPGGLHHPGCDVDRCPRCGRQQITCRCSAGARSAQGFDLTETLDACGRRLWEAAQTPGSRRLRLTFKVPQGLDRRAIEVELEVDDDGDVVWLAESGLRVIVFADGRLARER